MTFLNRGEGKSKSIVFTAEPEVPALDRRGHGRSDRTEYEFHGGEDPTLVKTDWPAKPGDADPVEVSEGEAQALLDTLYSLRRGERG